MRSATLPLVWPPGHTVALHFLFVRESGGQCQHRAPIRGSASAMVWAGFVFRQAASAPRPSHRPADLPHQVRGGMCGRSRRGLPQLTMEDFGMHQKRIHRKEGCMWLRLGTFVDRVQVSTTTTCAGKEAQVKRPGGITGFAGRCRPPPSAANAKCASRYIPLSAPSDN